MLMLLPRLRDLVLTRERDLRARLGMWMTSAVTYLIYDAILLLQVAFGWVPPGPALGLIAVSTATNLGFYVALRTRWSERFGGDKSLGVAQLLVGIGFFWITYAITGPASPATLVIVVSHTVYFVFAMPKRVRQMSGLSLAGLGLLMVACHGADPRRYPADLQLVAFLYTALVVGLVVRLEGLVTSMTERIRSQRNQLEAALGQVQQLAIRDELTQLHNRRHMVSLLAESAQRAAGGDRVGCLALVDIDLFKRVNDAWGHPAGDEVLRRFAALLTSTLRDSDVAARWGGEEFLVLLPRTPLAHAQAALQRVQDRLAAEVFGTEAGGAGFRVSFSAGLAEIIAGKPVEQAVSAADAALYRAKQAGRRRIVPDFRLAPTSPEAPAAAGVAAAADGPAAPPVGAAPLKDALPATMRA